MKYSPALTRLTIASVLIVVAFFGCALVIVQAVNRNASTISVVHERVLLATDAQITNEFIDELLTPKSARCFRAILMKESHMRPAALNKESGAKGMGQLLASTYRNLGIRHSPNDPLAQAIAALAYIGRKFGGASATCNAWTYWQKHYSY